MSGEGFTNSRPIETSTLGPIRVEPNAIAERARVVREALDTMRKAARDAEEPGIAVAFDHISRHANDALLAKLGRLLK